MYPDAVFDKAWSWRAISMGKPRAIVFVFCKTAFATVLALGALGFGFILGGIYADVAISVSSEPVYEVTPERVDPAYEGKFVRMRVTELRAEGGPVEDATFGLCLENTLALRRFFRQSEPHGRIRVNYTELAGIREAGFRAPVVKAGAYSVKARKGFWEELGG